VSSSLAIAAVTATLRALLDKRLNAPAAADPSSDALLAGTVVTTRPPDEAQGRSDAKQLNLFLYRASLDGALRNNGAMPPLPLTLHYLVTPYVRDDQQDSTYLSERLLGRAMSILHDHPVLGPAEIEAALPGNDLHRQVERVRVVPETLSAEELSKLWACFQAKFRVSACYQVAAVLIDSVRPTPAPLPVLSRGADDRGPLTSARRAPVLAAARAPEPLRAARLGDELTLTGEGLDEPGLRVRIEGVHLAAPLELEPLPGVQPGLLRVRLRAAAEDPDALVRWAPGLYTAALVVQRPGLPVWTSSGAMFALCASVTVAPLVAAPGDVALTLAVTPRLRAGQRVRVLFGERELEPQAIVTPADPAQPSSVQCLVPGVAAGAYRVRLRVDGVDSLPVLRSPGPPPNVQFDPAQTVTVA
jgi:hypothetical protein